MRCCLRSAGLGFDFYADCQTTPFLLCLRLSHSPLVVVLVFVVVAQQHWRSCWRNSTKSKRFATHLSIAERRRIATMATIKTTRQWFRIWLDFSLEFRGWKSDKTNTLKIYDIFFTKAHENRVKKLISTKGEMLWLWQIQWGYLLLFLKL